MIEALNRESFYILVALGALGGIALYCVIVAAWHIGSIARDHVVEALRDWQDGRALRIAEGSREGSQLTIDCRVAQCAIERQWAAPIAAPKPQRPKLSIVR